MNDTNLKVIGRNTAVDFVGHIEDVPAKIDTGADSSSVWVSNVRVDKKGVLRFNLFDENSPYYTGKTLKRLDYKVAVVRSATGHVQLRYRTKLSIRVGGKRLRVLFNLSNRANNQFPVLIGRRTLANKFIVDVTQSHQHADAVFTQKTRELTEKLQQDPYMFYKKYYKKAGVSMRKKV
jgi:hypothetical protein